MSDWQSTIADAVKARGYNGKGMTREQYAFSQICKTIEELHEVATHFGTDGNPYIVVRELTEASHFAQQYFNNPDKMGKVTMYEQGMAYELADVLITLAMAADVLGVDLEAMAIEKATRDVSRGIKRDEKGVQD